MRVMLLDSILPKGLSKLESTCFNPSAALLTLFMQYSKSSGIISATLRASSLGANTISRNHVLGSSVRSRSSFSQGPQFSPACRLHFWGSRYFHNPLICKEHSTCKAQGNEAGLHVSHFHPDHDGTSLQTLQRQGLTATLSTGICVKMLNTSCFFPLKEQILEVCKYIILFMINEMKGKSLHQEQEHVSFSPTPTPRIAQVCFLLLCPQARATRRKAQRGPLAAPSPRHRDQDPDQPSKAGATRGSLHCSSARPFTSSVTAVKCFNSQASTHLRSKQEDLVREFQAPLT